MAVKTPIVNYSGTTKELQTGDYISSGLIAPETANRALYSNGSGVISTSANYTYTDATGLEVIGSTSTPALIGTNSAGVPVKARRVSTATTTMETGLTINKRNSSGTPAAQYGVSLDFELENSTTEDVLAATLGVEWGIATNGSERTFINLSGRTNGATTKWFRFLENRDTPNTSIYALVIKAKPDGGNSTDLCLVPHSSGSFLASVPDNTTTGGNKRGTNAVDLGMARAVNTQVASGAYSCIPGGYGSTASGDMSFAFGAYALANHNGEFAFSGQPSNAGKQFSFATSHNQTTNATPTELLLYGGTRFTVASETLYSYRITVIGRRTDTTTVAKYVFEGLIKNDGGTTTLPVSAKTVVFEDVAGWDAAVTADNTNDALVITVTGAAATTIEWMAFYEMVKS